jgi:cysteine desulfurase
MTTRTIYFDYNATTPLDETVRSAMLPFLGEIWGNPSSSHHVGRRARAFLDEARDRAALVLGCKPSELIFTSGGTESNNLAIFGAARLLKDKGRHIITTSIEHHAVLHSVDYLAKKEGFEVTFLPVTREGFVSVDSLKTSIRSDTILVSIMAANNEIGTIQPVAELGDVCRQFGVLFHTDAVQWFGKEPFESIHQFNADLVSICSHKFHGPKGAGLLFVRSPIKPYPVLFRGSHENERRAGTENLSAIVGFVEAVELFVRKPVFDRSQLSPLVTLLRSTLERLDGVAIISPPTSCLGNTISFVLRDSDSSSVLAGLDLEGICASSGSACSAGSLEPSHVVSALGFDPLLARSLIRFSLGRLNTLAEVDFASAVLPLIVKRARSRQ